jgi:hypothetical protein
MMVVAILYLAGVIDRAPRLEWARNGRVGSAFLYLWPILSVTLGFLIVVWNPSASFPAPEFYRVACEVIVLFIVALIVDREVLTELRFSLRLEYGLFMLAGLAASLLAVSQSLPDASENDVGGGVFLTTLIASFTAAGLLAAAALVIAAVVVYRGRPEREADTRGQDR